MQANQANAKEVFVLSSLSRFKSPNVLCGTTKYTKSLPDSKQSGYFNENTYTRSFVYGFKNRALALYWRDMYVSDTYQYVSESTHGNTVYLNFVKNEDLFETPTDPLYVELESLYEEKVYERIQVSSLEEVDEEMVTRMVLCYFMTITYIFDVIQNDHGVILKGVRIDPFEHIDDPLEVQEMVMDSLELNYYI